MFLFNVTLHSFFPSKTSFSSHFFARLFLKTRLNEKPWKLHYDNKCWSNVDSNQHARGDWACAINIVLCVGSQKGMGELIVLQSKLNSLFWNLISTNDEGHEGVSTTSYLSCCNNIDWRKKVYNTIKKRNQKGCNAVLVPRGSPCIYL